MLLASEDIKQKQNEQMFKDRQRLTLNTRPWMLLFCVQRRLGLNNFRASKKGKKITKQAVGPSGRNPPQTIRRNRSDKKALGYTLFFNTAYPLLVLQHSRPTPCSSTKLTHSVFFNKADPLCVLQHIDPLRGL